MSVIVGIKHAQPPATLCVVVSVLARVVRALARLLPDDERADLGMELGERVNDPRTETATPPEPAADGVAPDWTYVWNALLDASAHAFRIEGLLEDERAFFSFDTIRQAAGQLREQIDDAYNLMCTAPLARRPAGEPGNDLDVVREQVDLRRADIVDTEIAPYDPSQTPTPPPGPSSTACTAASSPQPATRGTTPTHGGSGAPPRPRDPQRTPSPGTS